MTWEGILKWEATKEEKRLERLVRDMQDPDSKEFDEFIKDFKRHLENKKKDNKGSGE